MTTSFAKVRKGYAGMNAGVWVGNIPYPLFEGIQLKVRRLWNPDYTALHEQLMEQGGDLSEADKDRAATTECLVKACLLDWSGVEEPFAADTATALLADPEFGQTFRNALIWAATHVAETVAAQLEADEKNS